MNGVTGRRRLDPLVVAEGDESRGRQFSIQEIMRREGVEVSFTSFFPLRLKVKNPKCIREPPPLLLQHERLCRRSCALKQVFARRWNTKPAA